MNSINDMIKTLQTQYPNHSIEELEKILQKDDWNLRNYEAIGKYLKIDSLNFKGKKKNDDIIDESYNFYDGVTLLYSNEKNNRGKSTIVAIIYLCLTGDFSKIEKNMKNWFSEFTLNYSINHVNYINKFEKKGKTWHLKIENESTIIKEVKFKNNFENILDDFFLNKFDYYKIGYTQAPNKNAKSFDRNIINFSWKTYLKTIFLMQKEYSTLVSSVVYGKPNQIIHHMLNLKYKQLHNIMEIKSDLLNDTNKQSENFTKTLKSLYKNKNNKEIETMREELNKIDLEIIDLKEQINSVKENPYIEKYRELNNNLFELSVELEKIKEEIEVYKNQIKNSARYIQNIKDSIECKFSFYLEPEYCPICQKEITQEKIKKNKEQKTCILCGEETDVNTYNEEEMTLKLQIEIDKKERLNAELNELINNKSNIISDLKNLTEEKETLIPTDINLLQENLNILRDRKEEIIKETPFLISEPVRKDIEKNTEKLNITKSFLNIVENSIKTENEEIFEEFSKLLLKILKKFTKTNITNVIISKKTFLPIFIKDDTPMTFEGLNAGEEVRAKLALYLSLLLFSLKNNIGNNPHFLVIDSPTKEEMEEESIVEISDIIKELNDQYSDKIQIIIASAKDITSCTSEEKVISKEEYFF